MSKYQYLNSHILELLQSNLNNTDIARELIPSGDYTEIENLRKYISKIKSKDLENLEPYTQGNKNNILIIIYQLRMQRSFSQAIQENSALSGAYGDQIQIVQLTLDAAATSCCSLRR